MTHQVKSDGRIILTRKHNQLPEVVDSIKNRVLTWFQAPPSEAILERRKIVRTYGILPMLKCKLQNEWNRIKYVTYVDRRSEYTTISLRFPRERVLSRVLGVLVAFAVIISSLIGPSGQISGTGMSVSSPAMAASAFAGPVIPQPINWLDGVPESNGFNKDAITGPFEYAQVAGYTFASDQEDVGRMIEAGQLVKLESEHILLVDVSQPFVMPVVADFVNRLAELYASKGCGQLYVTSALRTEDVQGSLHNGHVRSVHPTGMSVDLRRYAKEEQGGVWCQKWLGDTLLEIEADRRIDVTFETSPRHFHVVVVPDEYERYLTGRVATLDPEVHWLATAMYFEGHFKESRQGRTAIAWTIANRMRSEKFPDSIIGVIADGAAGRSNGGCQFSFMCDGAQENIQKPCANKPALAHLCTAKWEEVVQLAKEVLPIIKDPSKDPTNGAVLYYASWMPKKPHWAARRTEVRKTESGKTYKVTLTHGDFVPGSVKKIGSHIFGCSLFQGRDVCRYSKGVSA